MKTNLFLLKKCIAFALLMTSMSSFGQTNVVGYFPTYQNFPNEISNIDLAKLTHLNIAFANPTSSGSLVVDGASNSAVTTVVNACHAQNVKVLLSIGGGGAPGNYYSTAFSNSTNMTNFVNSCVNYTTTYNLDGIDVDIEGDVLNGSQVTSAQYQSFVTQLGAALHAKNKIMTAAVADWFGSFVTNTAVAQFDFIGVMAYDQNVPGSGDSPGPVGDYQFAVDSYNYWHAKGVPGSKINIGVPFYGYGWGTYTWVSGGDSYASIVARYPGAENFDIQGSGANAEYYNGIPTIKQKTAFAIQNGGGIMIWDVTMDATGSKSLLTAINQVVVANSNPVPANLATGKSVTVSSTEVNSTVSTAASNAVDGNYATRWGSLFADPQWITVDLGANYNVNRVKLSWEAAYATAYQIQISSDNTNWTALKSVTGNTTTTNDQTGLSGTGRYVRIYGTARATVYGYSLYEIEVYGTAIESPYSGTAISLPGTIQAENYDLGGEGLAYHDIDAVNQAGAYRTDGVDIEVTTDAGGGYDVGYIAAGEWLKYTVNVTAGGTYNIGFRTAGTSAGAISLLVDGSNLTGTVNLPNTGGWQTWTTTTVPTITLTAGQHIIELLVVTAGFNLNDVTFTTAVANQPPTISLTSPANNASYTAPAAISISANAGDVDGTVSKVDFYNGTTLLGTVTTAPYTYTWSNVAAGTYTISVKATDNSGATTTSAAVAVSVNAPTESPYGGTAIVLPGTIQAENYDLGGEGVSYHDIDAVNQGGTYRTDGVDIEVTTDAGGGYDVGYIAAGEWLKYTVNVTAAGAYNIGFRTAGTSAGAISLLVDGANVTGTVSLPNTGGWQTWATTTVPIITLTAGQHIIELLIVTAGFNLNAVTVTANQPPSVSLTAPANNASYTAPAAITISANAADVDGTVSKVDFYNGTTLLNSDNTAPYTYSWTNVAAGSYTITAIATDNSGASTTSAAVNVSVNMSTESPYGGTPIALPGTIQAENYDLGGEGIAYHDVDAANQGGAYRTDGVDIQATTDVGGGYNVGYIADGEWLKYTVNVTAAGTYSVSFRTAATSTAGVISMQVDGSTVAGPVSLPNTGAWQTWATTTVANIAFTAGQHVITLQVVTGGFNLNYVTVAVPSFSPGYLHASGKNIVNNGGNFIIKAINIGDYMIQEGYMMNMSGSQYIYRDKIATMVGTTARDQFYANYYQNFITKADIDSIAKWGFNSIRLPMHYELFTPLGQPTVFLTQGFAIVDSILGWAKANNIYVILDLHAAPGGENSGDISDYNSSQPSLWESQANRDQTVALWAKLAARYANEQYIGGYDLINETDWTLPGNTLLMQLMQNITTAIRQVDKNHILFIEGNSYANDYTGLTPPWDNNMAYSFHKYWNDDSQSSLDFVLSIRDGQNVPIWMGEFGENSNNWIANAVTLMNQNNIGWAIWPYKKMSSVSSISSFKQPSNWSVFADYVNGGAQPSAAAGQAILNELLEDVKVSNCVVNKGYLYALFQQPGNTNTIPYAMAAVSLPGRVTAVNYDEGLEGYAYNDAAYQNTQYGSTVGSSTNWNQGWYYRNDGVDLQYSTAENAPTIGWTENGDWMQYTVNITTAGSYAVKVRVAGNGGTLSLSSDGTTLINSAAIASTGGWDTWQTLTLGNVNLTAGSHKLRFTINTAGYNLSYFDFSTQAVVINQAPSVSITSPTSAASFTAPASITINATASDVDGTVSKVDFYYGTTLIGTDNTSPYSFVWSNAVAGNYSVTAKATDNSGAVSTSASVSVVVTNAATTTPTNTCSGVAQYVENNGYVAGSTVQSGGVIYQCKPYPYTGWCNGAAWAYGPGTGTAWTDAWIQMGTCSNVRVGAMNSVSTSSAVSTIQLVPNPTTGVFTIATTSDAAVQVLNSYGEEVLSVNEVAANGSVDITALSAGVYFVKIISADGNLTIQKIVKQ